MITRPLFIHADILLHYDIVKINTVLNKQNVNVMSQLTKDDLLQKKIFSNIKLKTPNIKMAKF